MRKLQIAALQKFQSGKGVIIHSLAKSNGQKLADSTIPLLCKVCKSKQIVSYLVREGISLLILNKLHHTSVRTWLMGNDQT